MELIEWALLARVSHSRCIPTRTRGHQHTNAVTVSMVISDTDVDKQLQTQLEHHLVHCRHTTHGYAFAVTNMLSAELFVTAQHDAMPINQSINQSINQ